MSDEFDHLLDEVPEVVTETPSKGDVYERWPGAPPYAVADVPYQHPQHQIWARQRIEKGLEPPFYVLLPSGEIGWVPWPGSPVVSQQEAAWGMDMLRDPSPAPKGEKRK